MKKVFLVSTVDRIGMAEEFLNLNAHVTFGDLICSLGIPIPIKKIKTINRIAELTLPVITQLPFHWLYPTGEKQKKRTQKFEKFFVNQDIIAGDWHYINKFLPSDLTNKVIITNSVTKYDIKELENRNLKRLVTTTPHLNGRSFGTNIIEALILAFSKKTADEITLQELEFWIEKFNFEKFVLNFKKGD